MSLDQVVKLSIVIEAARITRAGFGTALIMAGTPWVDKSRIYTDPADMLDDGFTAADPAYRAALILMSQNPRPSQFKIGKRGNLPSNVWTFTPTDTTEGRVYGMTIEGVEVEYTVQPGDTATDIAAGLDAAITGASFPLTPAFTNAAAAGVLTLTVTTPGEDLVVAMDPKVARYVSVENTASDAGIVADYNAIKDEDADWYAVYPASSVKAEIVALAAAVEADRKVFVASVHDSECEDPAETGDVLSLIQASNYARSSGFYLARKIGAHQGAAILGSRLPTDPGSSTWAYKSLAGVPGDNLSANAEAAILAKSGNVYATLGGVDVTRYGTVAAGEYVDVIRGVDWLYARTQERCYRILVNSEKVPYTDTGIESFTSAVKAQLAEAIRQTVLAADPAPVVTAPKVADIDTAEKLARNLPDVKFTGTLAGAIHTLEIDGRLSV